MTLVVRNRHSNLNLSLHCLPLALLLSSLYSHVIQVPVFQPVGAAESERPQQTCSAGFLSESGCGSQEEEGESFSEELLLRPLPDGKILAHFHFSHKLPPRVQRHFTLFPKAIAQLVRKWQVREMELSFTQGRWDHKRWGGAEPLGAAMIKPPGVELWASFATPPDQVDAMWRNLTHSLSGLFCASLNILDSAKTTPAPTGDTPPPPPGTLVSPGTRGLTRYGALPREAVCTENITPWLKLLPCRDKAGIASLLHHRPSIYSGVYHLQRVKVREEGGGLRLTQSLTLVLDGLGPQRDWSMHSLFKRSLGGACPVAQLSEVYVEVARELAEQIGVGEEQGGLLQVADNRFFQVTPVPHAVAEGRLLLTYHPKQGPLDVRMRWKERGAWAAERPPFYLQRVLTGKGNERGGIALLLQARGGGGGWGGDEEQGWEKEGGVGGGLKEGTIEVRIFQVVPSFVRLFFHTLRVQIGERQVALSECATWIHITPAEEGHSPALLEMSIQVAASDSFVMVSIDFHKALLHLDGYPPDASRGMDIPSAIVEYRRRGGVGFEVPKTAGLTPLLQAMESEQSPLALRIYSEALVVPLPIPDFSMPYNVITITCTALVMLIGSLLNALRKRPGEKKQQGAVTKARGVLGRLRQMPRLARLLGVCVIVAPVWLALDRDAYDEVTNFFGKFL